MIAVRRVIKQGVYAALGLGLIALAFFIVVLPSMDFFRRDPAISPPPRESIIIESVDTIAHEGTIDLIARVRNPNPRAGVPHYTLVFILLDEAGQEITAISQPTYLLPGSLKYVAVLDVAVTKPIGRVRVEQPADPVFTTVNLDSALPSFSSFLRERTIKDLGNQRYEVQVGMVTNAGNFGYRHVDIVGIGFDAANNVVGVGKTFAGELKAGEQREFTLQWPKPFTDTAKVIVLPDTNIYSEDNILSVSGDPGRLREQPTVTPE